VLLNPVESQRPASFPAADAPDQFKARMFFFLDLFYDAEFMNDMREACYHYPNAEIHAYVPDKTIGTMLDFNGETLEKHLQRGAQTE
ncbi:unnamed protein product, partial [Polarella glacialis]